MPIIYSFYSTTEDPTKLMWEICIGSLLPFANIVELEGGPTVFRCNNPSNSMAVRAGWTSMGASEELVSAILQELFA